MNSPAPLHDKTSTSRSERILAKLDNCARRPVKLIERYRAGSFILTSLLFIIIFVVSTVFILAFPERVHAIRVLFPFLVAFFGLAAAVGACLHLFEVQRQNQMSNEIQKASFLLDLDNRFIQPQMLEAQNALSALWERAHANIHNPPLSHIEYAQKSRLGQLIENRRKDAKTLIGGDPHAYHTAFCNYLTAAIAHDLEHLRTTDPNLYHILLRNCEIFETMGLLKERDYLNYDDVSTRFRFAIHRIYVAFYGHISLRDKPPSSHKLFQNVLSLGKWHEEQLAKTASPAWTNPAPL